MLEILQYREPRTIMLRYLIMSAILVLAQGHDEYGPDLRMPQPCAETQMSAIRKCGGVDVMIQLMTKRSFSKYTTKIDNWLRLIMDCSHYMNADTDGDRLHVFRNISHLFGKSSTQHGGTDGDHDDDYCQMFERYEQCVTESGVRELCASPEDITLHIASAYMCGTGKKEYDEAAICLSNVDSSTLGIYNNPGCQEVQNGLMRNAGDLLSIARHACDDFHHVLNILSETLCILGEFNKRCLLPWARRECGASAEAVLDGTHRYAADFMVLFFKRIQPNWKLNKTCVQDRHSDHPKHNQEDVLSFLEPIMKKLDRCSVSWVLMESAICAFETYQSTNDLLNGLPTNDSDLDAFQDLCARYIPRYFSCVQPHIGSCPPNVITSLHGGLTHACSYMAVIQRETQCYEPLTKNAPAFKEICGFTQLDISGMKNSITYLLRALKFDEAIAMCKRATDASICIMQKEIALVNKYAPKDCSDQGKTAITSFFDSMIKLYSGLCIDMESLII